MRKLNKKVAIAAAGSALALAASGVAYAYWTTTGSGSGTGATTAGVTNTLSFTQTALTSMYPGDASQPLSVAIANTSPTEAVYVTSVKAYVTVVGAGSCDSTDFLLNGSAAPGTIGTAAALTWTAQELDAASAESHDATGTIQFNDKATNQDGCKSAVVTIHYLAA
jgi:hypothetical protein